MERVLRDASEVRFKESFFGGPSVYIVPNYQRPYSWESDKQVRDLIEDIEKAYERRSELRAYLLGSVYVAEVESMDLLERYVHKDIFKKYFGERDLDNLMDKDCNGIKLYLVVDGQQRIVTFSILLKHLGLSSLCLELDDGSFIPRIILGKVDDDFYQNFVVRDMVNTKPATISHKRIKEASEKLREFANRYKNDREFKKFLSNQVTVVRSDIADVKYSVLLFVSHTDRGKPLTCIDRLKSLLQFYTYIESYDLSYEIDTVFARLFELMDKLVNEKVFKGESDFEDVFFKILSLLFYMDKNVEIKTGLREIFRISPEDAYYKISQIFKGRKGSVHMVRKVLHVTEKVCNMFDHILRKLSSNDDYKRIFLMLKPSARSYALLVKLCDKFGEDVGDLSSRKFTWNVMCDVKGKFSNRLRQIEEMIEILENTELKEFMNSKLGEIKKLLANNENNRRMSILDLIEVLELSVWKAHKEPVEYFKNAWDRSFSDSNLDLQAVISAFNNGFLEGYRCNYMFDGDVFRYVFMEYERLVNGNSKILDILVNSNITVEHIFSQKFDVYDGMYHYFGFRDRDDYRDFVYSWANLTFLEGNLNSKVSDKIISNKAVEYKEFCDKGRTKIMDVCRLGEDLSNIDELSSCKPSPAYKVYLEMRELEIKLFAYNRFPPVKDFY